MFNMLTRTSKSCENKCCFDQHYQSGKITSKVSVLMIQYLVVVFYELWVCYIFGFDYHCSRNGDREKCYESAVKGLIL